MISFERANEIAGLYYDDVYRLCLSRLRNEEDAADVTQEVFMFFQEHYEELSDNNIKSWLYSVANYKIKEEFRAVAKREKELIYGTFFNKKSSADLVYEMQLDNNVSAKEINEMKNTILSSLSEKELSLFEMVYTKHMEYSEMAKSLNISEGAARIRVCRLKAKLKERVSFMFMALLLLFMKL